MRGSLLVLAALWAGCMALPPPPHLEVPGMVSDVDTLAFGAATPSLELAHFAQSGSVTVPRVGKPQPYVAHVAMVEDPRYFAVELPRGGCTGSREKTSRTAQARKCAYATNAGFFSFTAHDFCEGNLVSDGKDVQFTHHPAASFGLTAGGRIATGFLNASALPNGDPFLQLIGGAGWLVRRGSPNTAASPDLDPSSKFFTERAPRTAVGAFANGSVALVQVDGEEDIGSGLAVDEFALLLADLGVHTAINLDGGGSSVSVLHGAVISKPTCTDTRVICERNVSTITCVHSFPVNAGGGGVPVAEA